jgi:putative zinc finger protein
MTDRPSCEHVREVAPDVALGLLTGEDRALALAHLERCDSCRAEVASLAVVADEVLLAAPETDPPAGFTSRVLERLAAERAVGDGLPAVSGGAPGALRAVGAAGPPADPVRPVDPGRPADPTPRPAPLRRPRALALALAAAAAVLVVAGLVAVLRPGGSSGAEAAVAEMHTGTGAVVGEATAEGGASTALVTLDVPGWEGMVETWGEAPEDGYQLVVEERDGSRTLRALPTDVEGWSLRIDAPVDDITTVSVLDAEGRVWCTGRFTT